MALVVLALQILLVAVFIVTAQMAVVFLNRADTGSEVRRAERLLADFAPAASAPAAEIGRLLDLEGARFGAPAEIASTEIAVPLPASLVHGKDTQFIWTPRMLGAVTWAQFAPVRISLALVMLALMGVLLWRYRNLTNELERRRRQARELARRDSLTGLANRLGFEQHLAAQLQRETPYQPFALCYLDLDGFKKVNDRLGHAAGDALLRLVAGRLNDLAGRDDFVARLGGDEFAIILGGVGNDDDARRLAARLSAALAEPYRLGDDTASAPASIGVTLSPAQGTTIEQLLANADAALYSAKELHRDKFVLFQPRARVVQLSA